MNQTPDNTEQASKFAVSAIQSMEARNILATPMNFTIWYNYHAGNDPDLVRGLDALLENDVEFTETCNDEIYHKYFGLDRESEEVREASDRIESAIKMVLERFSDASKDAADYGEKLTEFSGNIAEQADHRDVRGLVLGILEETRRIAEKNQNLVHSLGDSAKEITLLRQRLEEIRQEALTDALTGISNRKFFDMRLREEVDAHKESGAPLSLLMIDIDHFKKFNDTYGHQVGDEVLRLIGRVLNDGVKGRDARTRYGGEEFAVILPQTCLKDATTVAEHLRATLCSRQVRRKRTGQSFGTVTISVGAAQYSPGEPIGQFVQRADKALYQAKRDGRNRVVAEIDKKPHFGLTG